jgi:hypothetical protein
VKEANIGQRFPFARSVPELGRRVARRVNFIGGVNVRRRVAEVAPFQFFLAALAGWLSRHRQDVIAYLVKEN